MTGWTCGAKQLKTCYKCNVTKEVTDYYVNKKCSDGYDTTCKECFKERASKYYLDNKKTVLERSAKDWLKQKERMLKRKYNMTLDDYVSRFKEQAGKCAICSKSHSLFDKATTQLVVDHDHETGEVRKLLCNKCNQGLGLFNDSEQLLLEASEYLKQHKG